MKLATWNVNGMKARLEFVGLWLKARTPDVVGLQEIKLTDDSFPHEFFESLGYRAVTHGQKGWNGVAVLSRLPVTPVQVGLPGQEAFGARYLTVAVDAPGGSLEFTTLYCPNGKTLTHGDFPAKLEWFDALKTYLEDRPRERMVLCGDFNVAPTPLDSWHGEAGDGRLFHTVEERARFEAIRNLGLTDLYRRAHPERQAFSWWDYRGGAFHRGQGLRIDLVLGTEDIARRLVDAGIDRDYRKKQAGLTASDHAPVAVDVDW